MVRGKTQVFQTTALVAVVVREVPVLRERQQLAAMAARD
jgi:hypothetical protein